MSKISLIRCLFVVCTMVLVYRCQDVEPKEQTISKVEKTAPDSMDYEVVEKAIEKEQRAQFYKIEGKAVVFFMLSKNEFNKLLSEMGDSYRWEAEALFNNFSRQANIYQDAIKKHNIKCIISTSEKFEIRLKSGKAVNFDRIEKDQLIGQILTDGVQQPVIEFGLFTNKDLTTLIEKFFKMQSLGYIPADTLNTTKQQEDPEESDPGI